MKTVILGPRPAPLEDLIERRKALGLDTYDELWEGTYHAAPAAHPAHGYVDHALAVVLDPLARAAGLIATGPFNLGTPDDYRVPDQGYHRALPDDVWVASAVVVVEVVSPDDETFAKFEFYAAHGVQEILVADPRRRSVRCFRLEDHTFIESSRSEVFGVTAAELTAAIDWPKFS